MYVICRSYHIINTVIQNCDKRIYIRTETHDSIGGAILFGHTLLVQYFPIYLPIISVQYINIYGIMLMKWYVFMHWENINEIHNF